MNNMDKYTHAGQAALCAAAAIFPTSKLWNTATTGSDRPEMNLLRANNKVQPWEIISGKKINKPEKKYYFFFMLCFLMAAKALTAQAQVDEGKHFFLFKEDWSPAKDIDRAAYFMEMIPESDSAYICRYYNKYGPMVRQEVYLDAALTVPNGRFCWYDGKGNIDSTGLVYRKRKDGTWSYYDDNLTIINTVKYDKGRIVEMPAAEKDIVQTNSFLPVMASTASNSSNAAPGDAWLKYLAENITVPDRFLSVLERGNYTLLPSFSVSPDGKAGDIFLMKSCEWSADAAILKVLQNAPGYNPSPENINSIHRQTQSIVFQLYYPSNDTFQSPIYSYIDSGRIFVRIKQNEAKFPGGENSWNYYLEKHLNADVAAINGAPPGVYKVVISYKIDKDGNVNEVKVLEDPGYGTAGEVVRVIKKSPRWIPAVQNGKNVIYRQKQAMSFYVSNR